MKGSINGTRDRERAHLMKLAGYGINPATTGRPKRPSLGSELYGRVTFTKNNKPVVDGVTYDYSLAFTRKKDAEREVKTRRNTGQPAVISNIKFDGAWDVLVKRVPETSLRTQQGTHSQAMMYFNNRLSDINLNGETFKTSVINEIERDERLTNIEKDELISRARKIRVG